MHLVMLLDLISLADLVERRDTEVTFLIHMHLVMLLVRRLLVDLFHICLLVRFMGRPRQEMLLVVVI